MKTQKRNFVLGKCVLGLLALTFSSYIVAGAIGDKPKESAPKVGEQPNSVVDDGSSRDIVPEGNQPSVPLIDEEFKGNRSPISSSDVARNEATNLRFAPVYVDENQTVLKLNSDGQPLYKILEAGPDARSRGLNVGDEVTHGRMFGE